MVRRSTFIALLLAAVVLGVFARVCTHEFTFWDDPATLHNNPRMNPPTAQSILWYWTWESGTVKFRVGQRVVSFAAPLPHHEMDIYMPLTNTVWGGLAAVAYLETPNEFGIHLNSWVFHSASVAVHVLTAVVVFALLRRIVQRDWAAFAGAVLFAVHPVQVEAVAWASGMKDLLCGLFSMIAVWQYLEYAFVVRPSGRIDSPPPPIRAEARTTNYWLAMGAFVLAMLAKPTGMMVPLLAAIVDWLIVRRPMRQIIRSLWPWMALAVPCALIIKAVQPAIGFETAPVWTRPFIAADALAFYLYKLVFPVSLAPDYGRTPKFVMGHWWVWVVWLVPAGVAVGLWLGRRQAPLLAAAGLLFVAGVLPVLGLSGFDFQFYSTTADHYLYPAMLGASLAAAWVLTRYAHRSVIIACIGVLIMLAGLSVHQSRIWQNEKTLWEHAVNVNPNSFAGHLSLGNAYYRRAKVCESYGQHEQTKSLSERAGRHFARALEIKPDYARAVDAMAIWLLNAGRFNEAIEMIKRHLRLTDAYPESMRPDNTEQYYQLGTVLLARKRHAEAIEQFNEVLKRRPGHEGALKGLEAARKAGG